MSATVAMDATTTNVSQSPPAEAPTSPKKRLRLEYLDGLRGLAALFVVLHHAHAELQYRYPGDKHLIKLLHMVKFLSWGHFSVDLFIVLSGYVLMLPVARSASRSLKGGFADYIKRRATRILPPYYAALAIALALIAFIPSLRYATSPHWDMPLVAFKPGILISHLLMLHNFSRSWIYRIDIPMWSVATEWQIYFIFPALLLPLWRKFGMAAAVIGGFIVGLLPHFLLPASYNLDDACFWYIGLFAMGMAGSYIGFSEEPKVAEFREKAPWVLISGVVWLALLAFGLSGHMEKGERWTTDPFVGLAATTLLIYCTRQIRIGEEEARNPSFLVRIFQHKWTVGLGIFSYSLYLIHYPLLALMNTIIQAHHVKPTTHFFLTFLVEIPIIVGAAYLFHLAFERRFMPQFRKTHPIGAPASEVLLRPQPGA